MSLLFIMVNDWWLMVILTNGLLMVGLFEHIPKKTKRGKLYGKPMVSRFPTQKNVDSPRLIFQQPMETLDLNIQFLDAASGRSN